MKILYVDDNRNTENWGCRGTSMALSLIFSKDHQISGRIYQNVVSNPVVINNNLFKRILKFSIKKTLPVKIGSENMLRLIENSNKDYVTHNPKISAENLLKYKSKFPVLKAIYDQLEACDAVAFNGEGDMIFSTPPRRKFLFQLMIIELAVSHFNKPVFYVNSMASDCPTTGRNMETINYAIPLLEKCKFVSVRDPISLEYLKSFSDKINCQFIPDALFTLNQKFKDSRQNLPDDGSFILPFQETNDEQLNQFDFSKPYICVGGSSSAAHKPKQEAIKAYTRLVESLKSVGLPIYLVITGSGDNFLKTVSQQTGLAYVPLNVPILAGGAILSNASVFVSGRFHPSIFASLGGTPCVFLGSNSHKTQSLQLVLEYNEVKEFSDMPSESECVEINSMVRKHLDLGKELRNRISETVNRRAIEAEALKDHLN